MSQPSPSEQNSPLVGDVRRQATDSLLGYDYQIWRTVEAWMRLHQGEILYIECAEDYDLVSDAGFLMAQIKNSPKAITLNSTDVKAAIQNYWAARKRNPNRGKLGLRFLTRGAIGHERDREFGTDKGLELWGLASSGDVGAARCLASYMQGTLSDASLIAFFKTAHDSQLIEELFSRIEWVAGEPDIAAVQLAVQRMAIQRGAQERITAQASQKAVAGLLEHCRKVAVRPDSQARSLTREDLQLIFEQNTTLPVPITDNIHATLTALLAPGVARSSFLLSVATNELPPLHRPYLPRAEFIATVANGLLDSSAILIIGSEGRGKTTVATILGHQVSGKVRWVDLTASPDESSIATVLEDTLIAVRGAEPPRCVILDNVPVAQGMADYIWNILKALLDSCRQMRIALLLTAKGVSDNAVDSRIRAAQIKVLSVPGLNQIEVEHFFAELGCPADRATQWATISLMQSGNGHPKLVYLHGLELRDNGWPAVTDAAIVAPPTSIEEARAHARLVASNFVSDTDRPFLYALSMATVPFDRAVALSVGARMSIEAPGESFDRLTGRWIERRGAARYSVTTMLNGQAPKIWADDRICEIHRVLFDALIGRDAIPADEAWGIFVHAFAGKEPGRVRGFLESLLAEDLDQAPRFAEALEVLLLMGSERAKPAIPFDQRSSILLRIVQFRIARVCATDKLVSIAESWAWEIEQIHDQDDREAAKIIRGLSIACYIGGDFPPSLVVRAIADASRYRELDLALDPSAMPPIPGIDSSIPIVAWLFVAAQTRCNSVADLDEFLNALDKLDNSIRKQMLQAFEGPYSRLGSSMVESAWVGELKCESPDWPIIIGVLKKTQSLAKKWDCEQLLAAAVKSLSIIYDEQLGDSEKALNVLRSLDLCAGSAILKDQEANLLFRRGDFESALGIWRQALGVDADAASTSWHDRFSMRKAAIAASELDYFDEAARWLQFAAAEARRMPAGVPAAAFEVDAAYCWFKHGDGLKMVGSLTAAAAELTGNYDREAEFFHFVAQKNLGNTVLWLQGHFLGDNERGTEPRVGSASNPDIDRAICQTLPASPPIITALMMLDLAHEIEVDTNELKAMTRDVEISRNAIVSYQLAFLKLKQTVRNGQLGTMADDVYRMQVAIWKSTELRKTESDLTTELSADMDFSKLTLSESGIQSLFSMAMTLRTIVKGSPASLAAEWQAALGERPRANDFKPIIARLVPHFAVDAAKAHLLMRASPPTHMNIGAAARFLASDRREPRDTLYAQAGLLFWLQHTDAQLVFDYALDALYAAFSSQWRQHLATPALLLTPRLTIPMLEAAINSKASIGERMLNLLLAGCAACRTTIPSELVSSLENLSSRRRALECFLKRNS